MRASCLTLVRFELYLRSKSIPIHAFPDCPIQQGGRCNYISADGNRTNAKFQPDRCPETVGGGSGREECGSDVSGSTSSRCRNCRKLCGACPITAAKAWPRAGRHRSMDAITSSLLSHLAFEFGLQESVFYNAYFSRLVRRVSLPRTESYYCDLIQDWVQNVDLSHEKLKMFEPVMRARPAAEEASSENADRLEDYLDFLAAVLRHTHKAGTRNK